MKKILIFMNRWWPTIVTVGVVLYATWLPQPVDPDTIPPIEGIDKIIHAVMMGGVAGAVMFDYKRADRRRVLSHRVVAVVTVAVMLFGVVDETVQGLLPIGRPSDWLDLMADWIGTLAAAFLAPVAVNAIMRRRQP